MKKGARLAHPSGGNRTAACEAGTVWPAPLAQPPPHTMPARPPHRRVASLVAGTLGCGESHGGPAQTTRSRERHHAPAARSSQWSRTTRGSSLHPRSQSEHTCERTRAGRACEGHGERTGRRVRYSSTRAPRLTLTRACRRGVWAGHPAGRGSACHATASLHQEERQRTCAHGHHGHHGHP